METVETRKKRQKMTQKQLLLVDLCSRLPYNVCVHIRYKTGEPCYGKLTPRDIQWFIDSKIENIKPYLRSMSSMTDEEAKEYLGMINDIDTSGLMNQNFITKVVDWLDKKMFDHRYLIPMGLALEASEDMYKNQ